MKTRINLLFAASIIMFILSRYLDDTALACTSSMIGAYAFGIDRGLQSQQKKDKDPDHK